MRKKPLTVTMTEDVHSALHERVGRGHIGQFLEGLARPLLIEADLEAGYTALAADEMDDAEWDEWKEIGHFIQENEEG